MRKAFELDMMRVVRSASFGSVWAPPLNGLTLLFATPGNWLWVTVYMVASEAIFVPIMMFLYIDQEETNIESIRPYVVPSLVIITCSSYATAYVLTMAMGHSSSFLPTLSYLGELPPESVVWTLGTALGAMLYAILVNIVSKQKRIQNVTEVNEYISSYQAVACGYASAIGLTCIAVFPAHAIAAYAHYTGMCVFFLGSIPFLMLMTPKEGQASMMRTPLFVIYAVSSCMYPILALKFTHIAVVAETCGAASWVGLIYDAKETITKGPRVIELKEGDEGWE